LTTSKNIEKPIFLTQFYREYIDATVAQKSKYISEGKELPRERSLMLFDPICRKDSAIGWSWKKRHSSKGEDGH